MCPQKRNVQLKSFQFTGYPEATLSDCRPATIEERFLPRQGLPSLTGDSTGMKKKAAKSTAKSAGKPAHTKSTAATGKKKSSGPPHADAPRTTTARKTGKAKPAARNVTKKTPTTAAKKIGAAKNTTEKQLERQPGGFIQGTPRKRRILPVLTDNQDDQIGRAHV